MLQLNILWKIHAFPVSWTLKVTVVLKLILPGLELNQVQSNIVYIIHIAYETASVFANNKTNVG